MIKLVPIGTIDEAILEFMKPPLEETFHQKVEIGDSIALPRGSWNQQRRQYLAPPILAQLPPSPHPDDRVLGVVDEDIYTPGLNFIFGQADILGRRALISLKRLRQEFYGLPEDENLFRERVLKESVHELGHTYGLGHCPDPACVMHFSNSLHDTDIKGREFCRKCSAKVEKKV